MIAGLRRIWPAVRDLWAGLSRTERRSCVVAAFGLVVCTLLLVVGWHGKGRPWPHPAAWAWGWAFGGLTAAVALGALPPLLRAAWMARVPVCVILAGALLLTVPDQTRHLIAGTSGWQIVWFGLMVWVTGMGAWFWCRWSLNVALLMGRAQDPAWGAAHLPHLAAIVPGGAAIIAVLQSWAMLTGWQRGLLLAAAFTAIITALSLVRRRRKAIRDLDRGRAPSRRGLAFLHDRIAMQPLLARRTNTSADNPPHWWDATLAAMPIRPCLVAAAPVIFLLLYLGAILWPGAGLVAARGLGPIPVVLLGLAALLTILAPTLGMASIRWRRPVVPMLALVVIGASTTNVNTVIPAGGPLKDRPTLHEAAEAYLKWRNAEVNGKEFPVMLVAAQGGASRAALWAAVVMHALETQAEPGPQLDPLRDIFAVSGISGGALGLAAVVSGLHQPCKSSPLPPWDCRALATYAGLRQDHLSPPLAGLLFSDLPWRLLGPVSGAVSLLTGWSPRERTVWAMESWAEVLPNLRRPLVQSTFPDGGKRPALPLLLTSGTHVETGRLAVTAPVVSDARVAGQGGPLTPNGMDMVGLMGTDPSFVTAASNASRFPYVSTGGSIRPEANKAGWGQVVDGGYFDNLGTHALYAAAQALEDVARTANPPIPMKLFVVQIWSDPELLPDQIPRCGHSIPLPVDEAQPTITDSLLSPFGALLHARGERANDGGRGLATLYCPRPGSGDLVRYFSFALGEATGKRTAPLNWTLSEQVSDDITAAGFDSFPSQGNRAELQRLRDAWVKAGGVAKPPYSPP